MDGENFDWKPPSEAEMKVLQARRERSDKISKLMGDYLLKGYRMLGSCCGVCGTILLRDRQQQDYCVCCNELETDLAKDDPAVSAKAARSQVEEHEQSASAVTQNGPSTKTVVSGNGQSSGITPPGKRTRQTVSAHRQSHTHKSTGGSEHAHSYQNETHIGRPACPLHLKEHHHHHLSPETMLDLPAGSQDIVPESMAVVMSKMYWATHELKGTASVEGSTQLCLLVKACADAITSLRYLVPGELTD
ncbi:Sjoegren syndrome/scleroderma autoantigen 1 homolog isoform X2 [Acanthaster planci]|uniref:Sjoegren syndrome/scleroderma autoantigen 1 homolog isoform X2 n=1 Tax=Acanthaster planci TaxID=133434 RepID=A0A8B7YIQ6_ACAPL|nr:Sjoegren syndrome/scleroderma autoantigen 1 homolog isoform X2 [Acanthaster planci]XP_022093119.1 Sjoegren syndrome/scleroderma autoantigen 1 homolog isoform X2 [Acanthaster planci]XP_022093120.1 Sjoegren syndrome/scleroderma autoantigen 1 homolog isoform X2 [Acanthaster planci]